MELVSTVEQSEKLKDGLTIGIDYDDVLTDFTDSFLIYHNRVYGTSIKPEDNHTFEISGLLNCSSDEVSRRIIEYYHTPEHLNLPPMPGSQEALSKLYLKHNLIVITSRPDFVSDLTNEWIKRNFPNIFRQIYYSNHPHFGIMHKKSKVDICHELGVKILVEDALVYAIDAATGGISVLLLDKPWNHCCT